MTKITTPAEKLRLGDKWSNGNPALDGKPITGLILENGEIEIRLNEGENVISYLPKDEVRVDRFRAKASTPPAKTSASSSYSTDRLKEAQQRALKRLWETEKDSITKSRWVNGNEAYRTYVKNKFTKFGEDFESWAASKGINTKPKETQSFWQRLMG